MPGVKLTLPPRGEVTAKFELTLQVVETKNGMTGSFVYNADLFEATTMERVAREFWALLGAIVENPERVLSGFSLISERERSEMVGAFLDEFDES